MKRVAFSLVAVAAAAGLIAATPPKPERADEGAAAAIAEGKLPAGYRDWRLISVAREEGSLDDIRRSG